MSGFAIRAGRDLRSSNAKHDAAIERIVVQIVGEATGAEARMRERTVREIGEGFRPAFVR